VHKVTGAADGSGPEVSVDTDGTGMAPAGAPLAALPPIAVADRSPGRPERRLAASTATSASASPRVPAAAPAAGPGSTAGNDAGPASPATSVAGGGSSASGAPNGGSAARSTVRRRRDKV
jgi:hypothetical protein